jgi:hypothetical protein
MSYRHFKRSFFKRVDALAAALRCIESHRLSVLSPTADMPKHFCMPIPFQITSSGGYIAKV